MSEMVKRVAEAVEVELQEESPKFIWAERIARAAIAAMREPTEEMVSEAWADALGEDAKAVRQVMIDEALK